MRLMRVPGVYRPQEDTWLLAGALRQAGVPPGARVLDLGTGSGVLAITAASQGAATGTGVDSSRRAVRCANLNARVCGLPVHARRGDLRDVPESAPFDLVLANPPYVPCRAGTETARTSE